MRVLVACEQSGVVRRAFRDAGHEAWSCDLEPAADGSEFHLRGDALLYAHCGDWDMMIAHPPCTYLSRAGARWWKKPGREAKALEAARFVRDLYEKTAIPRIAIENPIGKLNQLWRYPDQTIQPWQFGHPFSKATCLWLKNLPPLIPTNICTEYRPLLRANTSSRARRGIAQTGLLRGGLKAAITFTGIAEAMATQWGSL